MAHLTQKERMLLQDQLNHEQICITKYSGYASRARDPQIRNMFNEYASEEQQHYDTINNLLQGGQGQTQQAGGTAGTQANRSSQAGSQGAGWQTTGQGSTAGARSYSMTGDQGQTGSQTGAYQATSGGNQQGWLSDTRTVYGGQMSHNDQGSTGAEGTRTQGGHTQGAQTQGNQRDADRSAGAKNRRSAVNFEAGSEISMSTSDDKSMLNDMLMTEKYISGAYDTAVFEASNAQVRQALQHIQRDEQKHGEGIFNYMQQHGMYQPQ